MQMEAACRGDGDFDLDPRAAITGASFPILAMGGGGEKQHPDWLTSRMLTLAGAHESKLSCTIQCQLCFISTGRSTVLKRDVKARATSHGRASNSGQDM